MVCVESKFYHEHIGVNFEYQKMKKIRNDYQYSKSLNSTNLNKSLVLVEIFVELYNP
jgi:hypothetical protein